MAQQVSHGLKKPIFDLIITKLGQIGLFRPFFGIFIVDDVIILSFLLENDVINENE